jgi:uncharacterized membrane protein
VQAVSSITSDRTSHCAHDDTEERLVQLKARLGVSTGRDGAYAEATPVRRLGLGLRRRRRLRVGITQLLYVVAGLVLGLLVPTIPIGFTVPSVATGQMLLAVGAGLLTFIGVVFSLLFLVVQFGTTTFTPRLNLFHSSPIVWHTFGFYTGVLVFAFVAAFSAAGTDRVTGLVPVVNLQMKAFGSIQLASTLAQVTQRGREVLDGVYPDRPFATGVRSEDPVALPDGRREVVWTGEPGILQAVDVPRIVAAARDADVVIELVVEIGGMIQPRAPVAVVHGAADASLDAAVLKAIRTGVERTFEQDPALAFRVLVDIALRALSPAVNDPTTASQVLDSEETLMRMLVGRDLDVGVVAGPHGRARVLLPLPGWDDYVALCFDELIEQGAGHEQVSRRIERLLQDLVALAPASRRAPLEQRWQRLAQRAHGRGQERT